MTDQTPDTQNEPDQAKWSFLGFIVGVIVTVLALQYYGYIRFPEEKDRAIVSEFRLLSLNPEYEVKVSEKSSGKEAFCESGYLLLRPQNGKDVAGILVNDKNRPIECQPGLALDKPEE